MKHFGKWFSVQTVTKNLLWQQRGWVMLWLLWAIALLTVYYRQIWYTATGANPNPEGIPPFQIFLEAGKAAVGMGVFGGIAILLMTQWTTRSQTWVAQWHLNRRSQILVSLGIFFGSASLLSYLLDVLRNSKTTLYVEPKNQFSDFSGAINSVDLLFRNRSIHHQPLRPPFTRFSGSLSPGNSRFLGGGVGAVSGSIFGHGVISLAALAV